MPSSKIPGGTTEERLNIWFEHFKSLLDSDPPTPDLSSAFFNQRISESLPISCDPFNSLKLDLVLKSLNSSKFPGLDNIPPSIWKLPSFREDLLRFCHESLLCGKFPNV